jgi:hypothetical protein
MFPPLVPGLYSPRRSQFASDMTESPTLALFCKVVDNYGDIGICWRLARQLVREHGIAVTLWVDDLRSFARICPAIDPAAAVQHAEGVAVYHWRDQEGTYYAEEVADIVIEFFAVDIPPGYVTAMAQRAVKPVWLNLEGLTAEEWVEGCHTLPSMHPRLPLTKHFFFPGFTPKTGGLLREAGLLAERDRFQRDPAAVAAFLAGLGIGAAEQAACKGVAVLLSARARRRIVRRVAASGLGRRLLRSGRCREGRGARIPGRRACRRRGRHAGCADGAGVAVRATARLRPAAVGLRREYRPRRRFVRPGAMGKSSICLAYLSAGRKSAFKKTAGFYCALLPRYPVAGGIHAPLQWRGCRTK